MPPLPSTIQAETSNLIETLTRRQRDLQEFQIPQLRSFKGALVIQQRYAAELREDLDKFSRDVNILEALAEDHDRERGRREVSRRVQEFTQSLERMKIDTRAALLISKRAIDSLAQSNRDELLCSTVLHEKKPSEEKSGDALMNASSDVTEALRRTVGLMQGELERSVLSAQMLEQSSTSLRSTTTAHDTLSILLGTSKHLITALEKSDWLDRLLIVSAVAFFFLIVLYIFKQRVLDKGIRFAFWWTRFLPDFSSDAALLNAVRGEAATLLTTAATTTLSTVASMAETTTLVPSQLLVDDALSTFPHSDSPITSADMDGFLSTPSPTDQSMSTTSQPGDGVHYEEL